MNLNDDDSRADTAIELANRCLDLLNQAGSQKYFVGSAARRTFVDLYVTFIRERGPECFERYAARAASRTDGLANNPAFISYLRKILQAPDSAENAETRAASRKSLLEQLRLFEWIGAGLNGVRLLGKAGRCANHDWVYAKARHVDGLSLPAEEKASRFENELDEALATQPSGGGQ